MSHQHPHPFPKPPQRSRRIMMIQQQSPFPLPHPLLHPKPFPPHAQRRIMIHRMLHPQEPFPQLESPHPQPLSLPHPHPLLHPHPDLSSPQPQFVAAKSLMPETSRKCLQFIIWKGQLLCDKAVDRKTKISYNNYEFNIFVIFATKLTHSFVRK